MPQNHHSVRLDTRKRDPKGSINLSSEPDPQPDHPPPACGSADCWVNRGNLHKVFPGLQVRPRPEPNPAVKDDHDTWLQEYNQWGALKCPCGRGYFCREHGSWISGEEVGSGIAATSDEQKPGSCPAYHCGVLARPSFSLFEPIIDLSLKLTSGALASIEAVVAYLQDEYMEPTGVRLFESFEGRGSNELVRESARCPRTTAAAKASIRANSISSLHLIATLLCRRAGDGDGESLNDRTVGAGDGDSWLVAC
ncbi:hypothetical protein GQ44DRAFT_765612 [Phaeosphaeriaceae sp. PMI808]|nr:hypothetical protein GQ44DRAFT_765612 [Phaeosphaeriaceae sp. PMI808]